MKTVTEHIRQSILSKLSPVDPLPSPIPYEYVLSRQTLIESFESLRRNRLVCGFYRYRQNFHSGERGQYNSVDSAIERLCKYKVDGNQEHLIDASNLCMVEFILPACHPAPHFTASDDAEHALEL